MVIFYNPSDYKVKLFCILAIQCDNDLTYIPYESPCEKTCFSISSEVQTCTSELEGMEGCFCPEGMYRDGMYFYIFICTVITLKIGTPRLTTVAVLNIKQYDFTIQ